MIQMPVTKLMSNNCFYLLFFHLVNQSIIKNYALVGSKSKKISI